MKKNFRRMAAGLLSAVLAMTLLMPFALAANSDRDEGISPHGIQCPECYEVVRVRTVWQDGIVGNFEEICIHKPHGTDTWGYKIGQCVEACTNCNWYEVSTLQQKVLVRCYGSF